MFYLIISFDKMEKFYKERHDLVGAAFYKKRQFLASSRDPRGLIKRYLIARFVIDTDQIDGSTTFTC